MNGKRKLATAAVLAMALLVSVVAVAAAAPAAKPELALTIEVRKEAVVKDPEGKTKKEWREAKEVKPGDILKYTITYRNLGAVEARGAKVVDPIPAGTSYISGSAEGEDSRALFSLDGKDFQEPPLLRYKARQADGTETQLQATPEMYTHIRWNLLKAVAPGGAGSMSFKVRVK